MTKANWRNYIPQGKRLLLAAVLAYYLVCRLLEEILGIINSFIWRLFTPILGTPFFSIAQILIFFFSAILFYTVIFALSFAFIRYFFKLDDKPCSYFSKTNILIIFGISFLLDVLSKTISPIPGRFAASLWDTNLALYYIIASTGELIRLALLAAALIYIWKLTFKTHLRASTLFVSAYWNLRGLLSLSASLAMVVFSAFLSYVSWARYDGFSSSYGLIELVGMLSGDMQIFPQFDSFKFYTTLLLFIIPVFYRCKPQNNG